MLLPAPLPIQVLPSNPLYMPKKITINIGATPREIALTDDQGTRAENAIAALYNRPEKITDEEGKETPNPKSKDEFLKDKLQDFLADAVYAYEVEQAKKSAADTVTRMF